MSSQFIFAITTPVGNEVAGANEYSLVAFFFTINDTVLLHHHFSWSVIQTCIMELVIKPQSCFGTDQNLSVAEYWNLLSTIISKYCNLFYLFLDNSWFKLKFIFLYVAKLRYCISPSIENVNVPNPTCGLNITYVPHGYLLARCRPVFKSLSSNNAHTFLNFLLPILQ